MKRPALLILLYLFAVSLFSGGVWWVGYGQALDRVAERARADLSLAADRLVGQLQRFREIAVLMADHPDLVALIEGQGSRAAADALLLRTADMTGWLQIDLVDAAGRHLAGSGAASGHDHADAPYLKRALQGALGAYNAQQSGSGQRVFTYAAPIFSEAGPVSGAVVVTIDIGAVEDDWRGDPQAVWFTDPRGVVFLSNRSELVFMRAPSHATQAAPQGYDPAVLRPFFDFGPSRVHGHDFWRLDGGPYLPVRAIHDTLPVPVIGLTGEILSDAAPARRTALLQAAVAAAICLVLGAILFVVAQRRQALALAKAELEIRVTERTAELAQANVALTREVQDRKDAEAALKKAQDDLVQAGKLSALGQMSAGISHELNQPLMAIRSFAENADAFLERGKPERAGENLTRISELSARMARIIKNLRAFARNEKEPVGKVDLVQVITSATELTEARLRRDGVTLDWQPALWPDPVWARGGEVRLVQVFVNLINNAADAMLDQEDRLIRIVINNGRRLAVTIRDIGPGISEPDRIFDPFYSTKEVGSSEGMGLGLSISYGLVQSFGGNIRGANAETGAMFTVELEYWAKEAAA
ncbi:MAG: sensor histidine kinase [Brevirhabdus sp.]